MRPPRSLMLLFPGVATLLLVSMAAANPLPDFPCSNVLTDGGHVMICPACDGETLFDKGATVVVELKWWDCTPAPGIPKQDLWLDDIGDGSINLCPGGSSADHDTDASGTTSFNETLCGGGWTQLGLQFYAYGLATGPVLPIQINSADITGDRVVNLADIAILAGDLMGSYHVRSDFVRHGLPPVINLADIVIFSAHIGHSCP